MAITPTVAHTIEAITHAINLSPRLIDDAQWLHNEAYLPRQIDRDKPTRAYPLDPTNPDAIPGETHDLGLATDKTIRAYHEAHRLVHEAARLADNSTLIAANRKPQPRPVRPATTSWTADPFPQLVDDTVRRLKVLRAYGIDRIPAAAVALAWSSASHLLEAHAVLRGAMPNPDGSKLKTADRRCVNCKEPHTEPDRASTSECAACRMYRRRHNGQPRPYRRNADALKARDRRRERGEGHGDESGGVQAGTYRGSEWVPAKGP